MDVYLQALRDGPALWIVRLEAAKAIAAHPAPEAAGPLASQLDEEPRLEVRLEVVRALRAVGGPDALKAVLQALLDGSSRFRAMKLVAYDAACALSGKTFPMEDAISWRRYYEALRAGG